MSRSRDASLSDCGSATSRRAVEGEEPFGRVLGPTLEAHFKVETRAFHSAPHCAQALAGHNLLPRLNAHVAQVRIERVVLASVVEHDHEPIAAESLGESHGAFVHRRDRGALGGGDLDSVLDRVRVEPGVLAPAERHPDPSGYGPGKAT